MSNKVNKKSKMAPATICNIVCAVLLVVFFACQFLPYWTYTTIEGADKTAAILGIATEEGTEVEKTISLAEYVWLTEEHEDLFGTWKKMEDPNGNAFVQNDLVSMPFICTLLVIAGVVFCLWKNDRTWTCLFSLIAGIYATYSYLTVPVLKTGHTWMIHLIVSIVLLVGSLPLTVLWVQKIVKWFTVKK